MNQKNTAGDQLPAFSHAEYAHIINAYKPIIRDFGEVASAGEQAGYCLIRHDIEFSLPKAVALAELDHALGIQSTFFVQVKNGAYNPLAPLNVKLVQRLLELGHYVGLHFYISDLAQGDVRELLRQLAFQSMVLEEILAQKVNRFSYHRPPLWSLQLDLQNDTDLLNAYAPQFFELTAGAEQAVHIKYMADSQHAWKYGHPLELRNHFKNFQLLMHPDEWSETGSTPTDNFKDLIEMNQREFIATIKTECNHFTRYFP